MPTAHLSQRYPGLREPEQRHELIELGGEYADLAGKQDLVRA